MKGRKQSVDGERALKQCFFVCFYSNLMGETSHAKGQSEKTRNIIIDGTRPIRQERTGFCT